MPRIRKKRTREASGTRAIRFESAGLEAEARGVSAIGKGITNLGVVFGRQWAQL